MYCTLWHLKDGNLSRYSLFLSKDGIGMVKFPPRHRVHAFVGHLFSRTDILGYIDLYRYTSRHRRGNVIMDI